MYGTVYDCRPCGSLALSLYLSTHDPGIHMDLFLNPTQPSLSPPPQSPPQKTPPLTIKKKKKSKEKKVPQAASTGVGTYHASFTPLAPETNQPQAVEDPFGASTFAPCAEEDWWEDDLDLEAQGVVEEEEQREEDGGESWGAYDSTDTILSDGEDGSVCSSPPLTTAGDDIFQSFMNNRRRKVALKEHRAVYTGPQLTFDVEEDDGFDPPTTCV